MKKYNLLALAACLWMTTACSDFLELNESGYNSVEYQFSTFDRTKAVATNVYGYLKDGYSEVCSTMIDAATDDAVNAWSTNGIKGFYDGSWNTSAPIGDVWEYYYRAIAAANYFIEHCPADFPAAKYQEKYEEKLKELKLYPYEIQALGRDRKMNGPHAFRRGMGRQLLEANIPAPLICDILGHSSSVSLRQYTASSLEKLKVCAGTISAIPIAQEALL